MEATEEIRKIQEACQHPMRTPRMYMWRVGAFLPTLICDTCQKPVEGINQEQVDSLMAEFHGSKS